MGLSRSHFPEESSKSELFKWQPQGTEAAFSHSYQPGWSHLFMFRSYSIVLPFTAANPPLLGRISAIETKEFEPSIFEHNKKKPRKRPVHVFLIILKALTMAVFGAVLQGVRKDDSLCVRA